MVDPTYITDGVTKIGVDYMPYRTRPCLVVKTGNTETKYASFNNSEAAAEFMKILREFLGIKSEATK